MWRTVGMAGFVGIEVLLALAVGYLGGQWLDGKLGTAPWLKWAGSIAGVGAAINTLVRVVRQYNRSLERERQNGDDGSNPRNG